MIRHDLLIQLRFLKPNAISLSWIRLCYLTVRACTYEFIRTFQFFKSAAITPTRARSARQRRHRASKDMEDERPRFGAPACSHFETR